MKRIKLWPATGGDGIEVYDNQAARLIDQGWLTKQPKVSRVRRRGGGGKTPDQRNNPADKGPSEK